MKELSIVAHYLLARQRFRYLRGESLTRYQERRARRIVAFARRHSPYYRERLKGYSADDWRRLPPIGKAEMMTHFDTFNTRGIGREEAMAIAIRAETSRDFLPLLQGMTVGLSSGTSGHRGLFLVSPREQAGWAGVMLARALPALRRQGYRIALFLRSNSNLYERIGSRWLQFRWFDLMMPLEAAIQALNDYAPDILVGPPSLLRFLAEARGQGRLRIAPCKILSVAEVLEPQEQTAIEAAFGVPLHQIYQCTEGLLAISCPQGSLHIQEDLIALQTEPLSETEQQRVTPILTDLWRTTQPIIRYRLNDVLTLDPRPCACGSAFRVIAQIEGRCDDILYFETEAGALRPFFPDTLRRMILLSGPHITDYQVFQDHPNQLRIHLAASGENMEECVCAVQNSVRQTLAQYGCRPAQLLIETGLEAVPSGRKQRRVQRLYRH
jgi:putative adenylate-forming enzyme